MSENEPTEEPKAEVVSLTNTNQQKKKMAMWKKVVLGAVAFIIVIVVVASFATSGPAKASDAFVDNILSGNAQEAYKAFSSEAKNVVAEDQFDRIVKQMDEVLEDKASQRSRNIEGESGAAATGTMVYEVKGSDGTYELTVNLVKEDGDWKVLNFDNSLKN